MIFFVGGGGGRDDSKLDFSIRGLGFVQSLLGVRFEKYNHTWMSKILRTVKLEEGDLAVKGFFF